MAFLRRKTQLITTGFYYQSAGTSWYEGWLVRDGNAPAGETPRETACWSHLNITSPYSNTSLSSLLHRPRYPKAFLSTKIIFSSVWRSEKISALRCFWETWSQSSSDPSPACRCYLDEAHLSLGLNEWDTKSPVFIQTCVVLCLNWSRWQAEIISRFFPPCFCSACHAAQLPLAVVLII